jgi:hypothetical protein
MGENLLVGPRRSAADRLLIDGMQGGRLPLSVVSVDAPASLRLWQASLGLGMAAGTTNDRNGTDVARLTLPDIPHLIVTAIQPAPSGGALALPGLIEALRSA